MQDVTRDLRLILEEHTEAQEALTLLIRSPMFSRETVSRALGELSEHLVARLVNGERVARNNRGFDVISSTNKRIEVKSRQVSHWKETLQFNFSKHTTEAHEIFCVAWNDEVTPPQIDIAFHGLVADFLTAWGTPNQQGYSIRTNLRQLRAAVADRVATVLVSKT